MSDPESRVTKVKIPVEIERDDGATLTGFLFSGQTTRLSDLMNDNRKFLPFETPLGKFSTIKKESILSVTPLKQARQVYGGNDPYRILGVSEETSFAEMKEAYLQLTTEHHPDKIRGMGLADEYVELANMKMSRVNEAFQRIAKLRATAAKAEEERESAATNGAAAR